MQHQIAFSTRHLKMRSRPVMTTGLGFILSLMIGATPSYADQGLDESKYPNVVEPDLQFGERGSQPGQLLHPLGVAIGFDGNIYIADTDNHRIQVFDQSSGAYLRGWGRRGVGPGEFRFPEGLAIGEDGHVYVVDTGNSRVQVFDPLGNYLRQWGEHGFGAGQFESPSGIAVDETHVYVADTENHRIQVFDLQGGHLANLGERGDMPSRLQFPTDVAVDENATVYIANSQNNRVTSFRADGTPGAEWGTWGSYAGLFATPTDVEFKGGHLYVADLVNHRIQVFDTEGDFLYQWGRHPAVAHEGFGRMHYPNSLAVSPNGESSVVCESFENRCQVFGGNNVRTVQRVNDSAWWEKATRFHYGTKVAADAAMLAISELDTHAILVFDISDVNPQLITKFGDYGTRLGEFVQPSGILINGREGTIYASDRGNQRVQTYQLTPAPRPRPDVAGPDSLAGFIRNSGRLMAAYRFTEPEEGAAPRGREWLANIDPGALAHARGNQSLMLDPRNDRIHVLSRGMEIVRSIDLTAGGLVDVGRAINLAVDPSDGHIYVVDKYTSSILVYDESGNFLRRWGGSGAGPGQFIYPFGVAISRDGFVYVSDVGAERINKFDREGRFVLSWGQFGIGEGEFYKPKGVAAAENGYVYVVDFGNHRGQIFDGDGNFVSMFGIGEDYIRPSETLQR